MTAVAALQGHHMVHLVFWIGVALWLLFALAPTQKLLALIMPRHEQVGTCLLCNPAQCCYCYMQCIGPLCVRR